MIHTYEEVILVSQKVKLTNKQRKIIDFLRNNTNKSNVYLYQTHIAQGTGLSKQLIHVTIKKFEQLGFIERIGRKIYVKKVKKANKTNVSIDPPKFPDRTPSFHHLSFKIPVTKYPKSFFETFNWSKDPWNIKGQTVYYFEDFFKKDNMNVYLKKYGSQNVFVKFYVRTRDGNCKMHVGFQKVNYDKDISPKEGIKDFKNMAYSYMKRFIAKNVMNMKLDPNGLVKTKTGHFKEFNLSNDFKGIHYEDPFGIIDDSEDDKPELEYKRLEHAEFWTTFPKNFKELQDYIDNSDKKQKEILIKLTYSINHRFEEILNYLQMNDAEMKLRHEILKKDFDRSII